MVQARVLISGYVQGVGYRYFVKRSSQKMGICGWVKNLPDGRVEAVFQGKEEDIKNLIKELKRGSMLSEVKRISVNWEESSQVYSEFTISKL